MPDFALGTSNSLFPSRSDNPLPKPTEIDGGQAGQHEQIIDLHRQTRKLIIPSRSCPFSEFNIPLIWWHFLRLTMATWVKLIQKNPPWIFGENTLYLLKVVLAVLQELAVIHAWVSRI